MNDFHRSINYPTFNIEVDCEHIEIVAVETNVIPSTPRIKLRIRGVWNVDSILKEIMESGGEEYLPK